MAEFHDCHGSLVFLSNQNRTARRRNPTTEFNNGVIFSRSPLKGWEIFEVRLDKKMGCWSGSFAIGVTTCDPQSLEIPSSATGLKNGSWIMSGRTILRDGSALLDEYGQDLDELNEGDIIGVQRRLDSTLHFYVNGVSLGLAARDIPANVYAVIDVYGKCVEISAHRPYVDVNGAEAPSTASVVFHPHCGSLVKLCNHNCTAERQKANEEFKNAVTMTNVPLKDGQMFEVRVEAMTDMWAGSLEVGVTTHNPDQIVLPPTMTSMTTGTWMLSGTSVIINGQEVKKDYATSNLEGLEVNDKVGITRQSNGSLHFFINGVDQGVAVCDVPPGVYGVIDLYGAAVKVSVVSQGEDKDNDRVEAVSVEPTVASGSAFTSENQLHFHPLCGSSVCLSRDRGTALRPRALEEFNNAIVLTDRPLMPDELFEVRVDQKVEKWAGSLEIGITTHAPEMLEFPSTMTNVPSGTWMFSGGSVVQDGVTVIEDYVPSADVQTADDKAVGDTVGVLRRQDGTLHFVFNGRDLGVAAHNVPPRVYGVVDLYGRSAQATITSHINDVIPTVDAGAAADAEHTSEAAAVNSQTPASSHDTPDACADSSSANENWFRFSAQHGEQVAVSRDLRSAVRINPLCEFNNAVVMSHRPLRDDEMFEVIIEKLIDRWSGSLEAGVTTTPPLELEFPSTMTDLVHGSWMVSSASVIQDGETIMNGYACDLDKLTEGSRLGIMRKSDGTLHYFVDGEDCGAAASSVPSGLYAMIDLYGQCVQISVYDEDYRGAQSFSASAVTSETTRTAEETPIEAPSCFHLSCGKNINLCNNKRTAARTGGFNHGLVFSANPLDENEVFEIKLDRLNAHWSGSLAVGVTSATLPLPVVPPTAAELKGGTWIVSGSRVRKDSVIVKENYGFSLDRIQRNMRVGLQRKADGSLHVYVNGQDQGAAANDLPRMVYAVVDVYGVAQAVSITKTSATASSSVTMETKTKAKRTSSKSEDHEEGSTDQRLTFHKSCGAHVRLDSSRTTARRVKSFNHGTVISETPIQNHQAFQVRIKQLSSRWTGSLMIGVTDQAPDSLGDLPSTASSITPWIVVSNTVYVDGKKVIDDLPRNLDAMREGDTVGLLIDGDNSLFLLLNGERLGPLAQAIPAKRYAVLDLYGSCEEVTIVAAADQFDRGIHLTDASKVTGEHSKGPCDYRQLCDRFRTSLAIPDGYFSADSRMNVCYCQTCHEARGEKRYAVGGDPPCRYALPIAWSQFAFRIPPRQEDSFAFDKWHVAFYGSHVGKLRRILDMGDLPVPNCSLDVSRRLSGSSNKNTPAPQLMVSPTILCVTSDTGHEYRDVTTGKCYSAQVALRLCVRPGAYKNGEPGCEVPTNELLDQNLGTENLGWFLKDAGVVILTALLIKIEPT